MILRWKVPNNRQPRFLFQLMRPAIVNKVKSNWVLINLQTWAGLKSQSIPLRSLNRKLMMIWTWHFLMQQAIKMETAGTVPCLICPLDQIIRTSTNQIYWLFPKMALRIWINLVTWWLTSLQSRLAKPNSATRVLWHPTSGWAQLRQKEALIIISWLRGPWFRTCQAAWTSITYLCSMPATRTTPR